MNQILRPLNKLQRVVVIIHTISAWKFFDDEHKEEKNNCTFLSNDTTLANPSKCQIKLSTKELFWEIWEKKGYRLPDTDTGQVYLFELSSERQQLILARGKSGVNYEDRLVLHGVRDMNTLKELPIEDIAAQYQWKAVQQFHFSSLEEVELNTIELDPMECSGYVVVDKVVHIFLVYYLGLSSS